jgi:hypothetical protein
VHQVSSFTQLWLVWVVPKYFNFATFSRRAISDRLTLPSRKKITKLRNALKGRRRHAKHDSDTDSGTVHPVHTSFGLLIVISLASYPAGSHFEPRRGSGEKRAVARNLRGQQEMGCQLLHALHDLEISSSSSSSSSSSRR